MDFVIVLFFITVIFNLGFSSLLVLLQKRNRNGVTIDTFRKIHMTTIVVCVILLRSAWQNHMNFHTFFQWKHSNWMNSFQRKQNNRRKKITWLICKEHKMKLVWVSSCSIFVSVKMPLFQTQHGAVLVTVLTNELLCKTMWYRIYGVLKLEL